MRPIRSWNASLEENNITVSDMECHLDAVDFQNTVTALGAFGSDVIWEMQLPIPVRPNSSLLGFELLDPPIAELRLDIRRHAPDNEFLRDECCRDVVEAVGNHF
ncbi:hypothetical protein C453_12781 [Haloferax elongans ATCC BAA-1513]|uniref:Uncharacterized protein n=1 Tax=Haloferax elongans ATCC BAA-1513 TaxID=1230453 RepID=M0HIV1_HALEO|nr:hypothetical protein C453_12781 [Haloferax elongans ATCC BAA-1513]